MKRLSYKDFFGLEIWVGLTVCPEAYRREMTRLKITSPSSFLVDTASATTHYIEPTARHRKNICLITIKTGLTKFNAYGLLVHESVHVVQRIKEIMHEEKIGYEMEAYAVQAISCFLWNEYDRQKGEA